MEFNQLVKLNIEDLANILEAKIHYKMQDLLVLGEASKTMQGKDKDRTYLAMAQIFNDMRPVEGILRDQNPHLNYLFDCLGDLYDKNKLKKQRRRKKPVVQRDITHPDDKIAPKLDFNAHMQMDSFDKN